MEDKDWGVLDGVSGDVYYYIWHRGHVNKEEFVRNCKSLLINECGLGENDLEDVEVSHFYARWRPPLPNERSYVAWDIFMDFPVEKKRGAFPVTILEL